MKRMSLIISAIILVIAALSFTSFDKGHSRKSDVYVKSDRTLLEIIVETTDIPALPFPEAIVINSNTGQIKLGGLLNTDVELNCEAGDEIIVQTEGINLIRSPVTAADMTAGVKHIYVTPL